MKTTEVSCVNKQLALSCFYHDLQPLHCPLVGDPSPLAHLPLCLVCINYHFIRFITSISMTFQAFSPYKVKTSAKTNQRVSGFALLFVSFPKQYCVLIMAQMLINILTLDSLSCLSLSYFMCKINHSCTSVKII